MRRRLAVICAQAQEKYQNTFIRGFRNKAFEADCDVVVFSSYLKYQDNNDREVGESTIFSLINYEMFDGICVLADSIQTPGALAKIEKGLLSRFKGKVLFVDKANENFPSVEFGHYEPFKLVVEHLICKHGLTDMAFLGGKSWHPHTRQRLEAYMDTMAKYGINVREDRIFYGDFWYDGGRNCADALLANPEDLPQAVVCANDFMAIGLADQFAKHGIRVPDDIIVTGYDSAVEGQESPSPLTSVPTPSDKMGEYGALALLDLLEGRDIRPFEPEYHLFIGGSCGCSCDSCVPRLLLRSEWGTDASRRSLASSFSRLQEDILARTDFRGVMDIIQTYSFQIREFRRFDICLNSFWVEEDGFEGDNSERRTYSEDILHALKCVREGEGPDELSFTDTFPKKELLPGIFDGDEPSLSFVMPLFFEDLSFGYAVISYDGDKVVDEDYVRWLRQIMYGLECIRRQEMLRLKNEEYRIRQMTDSLTGLYNYEGFVIHGRPMVDHAAMMGKYVCVTAVDVNDLSSINAGYGRKEGDNVIIAVARMMEKASPEGALLCRLGNDEFISACIAPDSGNKVLYGIRKNLGKLIAEYNAHHDYDIDLASGGDIGRVGGQTDMERLVNSAVSQKNGNKIREQKMKLLDQLSEEQKVQSEIVRKLLDENRFNYHFQPIVDAHTGEVFAYEALMRPDTDPYIGPLTILEYAEHLGRLVDVERATFFNVLKCIDDEPEAFAGKKVFINSIPGVQFSEEETGRLAEKLKTYTDTLVIELTEQTEADDETLYKLKTTYRQMGVQSAVDDYGTGYSNIINLLRYMPDYVKIDRLLLSGIQDNPQKQHFVREIVNFAHENKFLVLSEGVETSGELRTCIELGTDLIQGYYTGRPQKEVVREISPDVREEIFRYNVRKSG